MRRLLLPLIAAFSVSCLGGCSQFIADKVLIPPRDQSREAGLMKVRHKIEARWDNKLRPFIYKSFDGTQLAGMLFAPRLPASTEPGPTANAVQTDTKTPAAPAASDAKPLPAVKPRGMVVLLHGLTDRKESMLVVGEAFAEAGYVAVCPDLRAHGESGGRYTTLGFNEKRDLMALLNHLQSQGYDVTRVGAMGGSLGAAVSIQWAAIDPRVKAVIAIAPFADLRTELGYLYNRHKVDSWKSALAESAAQKEGGFHIGDISPLKSLDVMDTPLYLAHGFKDTIIPDSQSEKLFAAARGPVVFQRAICGHIDIRDALGKAFMQRSIEWMDTYVPTDAHPGNPPLWVNNYVSRNFPMTQPVAAGEPSTRAHREQ